METERYNVHMRSTESNPDSFQVLVKDRPRIHLAYVRIVGGYDPAKNASGLERLLSWGRGHGLWPGGQLLARSMDNPETTPRSRYRFDWCIEIPEQFKPEIGINFARLHAGRFAVLPCSGDIQLVTRAWWFLYRDWLPASGYQPRNEAAMEILHGEHSFADNAIYNLDCYIPIEPLN